MKKKGEPIRWSQHVTETSNALDLEQGIFTLQDARKIAISLKHSADQSERRKGSSFVSAMSMLNFYMNRAGRNLSPQQHDILNRAKDELRSLYGKSRKMDE
jgi:hypothetical protein